MPVETLPREGFPLKEMDETQRKDAFQLLATSLSAKGCEKAHVIINLETILGRIEQAEGSGWFARDPE